MKKILIFISDLMGFGKGHERTKLAKKNILASFFIKGVNIAIGLIMVPITLNYLEPTKYGIWVTLSSIIAWFGFFDIGMGQGLRNRFAEALAAEKHELARTYVSTTYSILSLIIGGVLILFYLINPFLEWNRLLNASASIITERELNLLAIITFTSFCFRFIFKLITTILTADQRPALASVFDLAGRFITLGIVIVLVKTTVGSLLYLGIILSTIPVVVLLASSFWFFNGRYRIYRPSIKYIDYSKARDLLNLGIKFFIIQIAVVLLYQTNNIIIAQLFGPEQVTPYNIAFKYFSVLMMGFTIVITPFWSAFTEAWVKKEIKWIKNIMRNLLIGWGVLFLLGGIMLLFSQWIFKTWVGDKVQIPMMMSVLVLIWVLLNAWNGIFSHFLNGVGKIQIQTYLGISAAILNVPLALFLGKRFGVEGVLFSNIVVLSVGVWLYPLQSYRLLYSKAKGIWNK